MKSQSVFQPLVDLSRRGSKEKRREGKIIRYTSTNLNEEKQDTTKKI
jgi:hypothetical protein